MVWYRSGSICVVPDEITPGWVHQDEDLERNPREESRAFNAYVFMKERMPHYNVYKPGHSPKWGEVSNNNGGDIDGPSGNDDLLPVITDDSSAIRRFVEETCILSSSDPLVNFVDSVAYVRGILSR